MFGVENVSSNFTGKPTQEHILCRFHAKFNIKENSTKFCSISKSQLKASKNYYSIVTFLLTFSLTGHEVIWLICLNGSYTCEDLR